MKLSLIWILRVPIYYQRGFTGINAMWPSNIRVIINRVICTYYYIFFRKKMWENAKPIFFHTIDNGLYYYIYTSQIYRYTSKSKKNMTSKQQYCSNKMMVVIPFLNCYNFMKQYEMLLIARIHSTKYELWKSIAIFWT